jgi:hypothetical protein
MSNSGCFTIVFAVPFLLAHDAPLISLLLWRFSVWIFSLKLMRRICPTYLLQDNNCGVNVSERVGDVLVSRYVPFTWRQISTALDSYCQ